MPIAIRKTKKEREKAIKKQRNLGNKLRLARLDRKEKGQKTNHPVNIQSKIHGNGEKIWVYEFKYKLRLIFGMLKSQA